MRCTGVVAVVVVLACVEAPAHAGRVTLKMGTLAADGSRYMKDIRAMSREIEERTGGEVVLRWYPDGTRGDELEMAAAIREGTLHGGALSDVGLAELVPDMRAFQYPGLFRDHDEVDRATSAVRERVEAQFADRELVFAMWADLGFSRVFSTARISSLEQVGDGPLTIDEDETGALYGLGLLGIDAVGLPRETLIERAGGDGATVWAMPPLYAIANGVHVRARYVWGLPYRYSIGGLVFAKFAWDALSAEQRAIVIEVCDEWEPKARKKWRAETRKGLEAMKKQDIDLHHAPESESEAFFELSDAKRAAYAAHFGIEVLMDALAAGRGRDAR